MLTITFIPVSIKGVIFNSGRFALVTLLILSIAISACSTEPIHERENVPTDGKVNGGILAALLDIHISKEKKVVLRFSEPIDIKQQVEIKLLSPQDDIWEDGKKVYSHAFGAYKYQVEFHDVKPDIWIREHFTDPLVAGGKGPVYVVQGAYSSNSSVLIINIGVGQEKRDIDIRAIGNDVVLEILE